MNFFAIICIIFLAVILIPVMFKALCLRKWRDQIKNFMYSSATLVGVYELHKKGLLKFSKEDAEFLLEGINKNLECYEIYFRDFVEDSKEPSNRTIAALEEIHNYLEDIAPDLRRYIYWGDDQATKEEE